MQNQDVEFIDSVGKNGALQVGADGRKFTPPNTQTLWLGFKLLENGKFDYHSEEGTTVSDILINTLLNSGWEESYGDDKEVVRSYGHYDQTIPYHVVETILSKFDVCGGVYVRGVTRLLDESVDKLNNLLHYLSDDESADILNRVPFMSSEEFTDLVISITVNDDEPMNIPDYHEISFEEELQQKGIEVNICKDVLMVGTTGLTQYLGYELVTKTHHQENLDELSKVFLLALEDLLSKGTKREDLYIDIESTLDKAYLVPAYTQDKIPLTYLLRDVSNSTEECEHCSVTDEDGLVISVCFAGSEDIDQVHNWITEK